MSEDDYALFDNFYYGNLERETTNNRYFREVISTTANMQLVLMSLKPGEDIGLEIHPYTTQFIRVEKGSGVAFIEGEELKLSDGSAVIIPLNTQHNITNTSLHENLKLYTIYSPPNHAYDRLDKNKVSD